MSNYEWDKQYSRQRIQARLNDAAVHRLASAANIPRQRRTFRILTWIQRLRHGRQERTQDDGLDRPPMVEIQRQ